MQSLSNMFYDLLSFKIFYFGRMDELHIDTNYLLLGIQVGMFKKNTFLNEVIDNLIYLG